MRVVQLLEQPARRAFRYSCASVERVDVVASQVLHAPRRTAARRRAAVRRAADAALHQPAARDERRVQRTSVTTGARTHGHDVYRTRAGFMRVLRRASSRKCRASGRRARACTRSATSSSLPAASTRHDRAALGMRRLPRRVGEARRRPRPPARWNASPSASMRSCAAARSPARASPSVDRQGEQQREVGHEPAGREAVRRAHRPPRQARARRSGTRTSTGRSGRASTTSPRSSAGRISALHELRRATP